MTTLEELYNKLDALKEEGKIVEWETVRDSGGVVVINIGYPAGDDIVNYENVAVRVYNRGTKSEYTYWERKKPAIVKEEVISQFEEYVKNNKVQILQDLKESYKVIRLISFSINKEREYITVRAFVDNGNNTVSEDEFIVIFDKSGNYRIYKKV